MPFLTAGGVTVPVKLQGGDRDWSPVGDYGRAEDGTPLATISDWKGEVTVSTHPIPKATADTLIAALQGAPPIAVTGDWSGSMNVIITSIAERSDKRADGERRVVRFTYLEDN